VPRTAGASAGPAPERLTPPAVLLVMTEQGAGDGHTGGPPDTSPHLRGGHQQLELADSRLAGVDPVLGEDRH